MLGYALGWGVMWALAISGIIGGLSFVRGSGNYRVSGAIAKAAVSFVVFTILLTVVFYAERPTMTLAGFIHDVFWIALIAVIISVVADALTIGDEGFFDENPAEWLSLASVMAAILLVVTTVTWVIGHNSGHNRNKASSIVHVTQEGRSVLPASSTSNMVVVSPDIATTRASQAMSSGIAGQRNYNTYLNLGNATLQYVDGHMVYVFPLHFDGSGNKHRLHNIEPGYIAISAEDPNAAPVERYDGVYSMKLCQDCGQMSEVERYAYAHGYSGYKLDDPTLELDEQGRPYWTITLLKPHLGWTFYAPSKVLIINAHTGAMHEYALGNAPSWVDRVYSQGIAEDIATWWGQYKNAGFKGPLFINRSNAGRLKVSGKPVLVYTGDGHPDWRMLLTSYNSDNAVAKIVIMDAHTGAMRVYEPAQAMGVEDPVTQAFESASGQGTQNVKANKYKAVDLTLHVIYGKLTWMATYEPEGNSPSFVGVGFVDAYHATASNVVFGNSKDEALQNYLLQLAAQGNANGIDPSQTGNNEVIKGTVAQISWDVSGGQKVWYVTLTGDTRHVYTGTVGAVGPALTLVLPGDDVTISYKNTGKDDSIRTMLSFTDTRVPLTK